MTIEDLKKEITHWRFSRYKLLNFTIGFGALLVYEFIARPYYRPFIYSRGIHDFHIADTLGNSLGTIATVFILISLLTSQKTQGYFLIRVITFSLVLYELAHPLLGKPTDPWDILATILTGGISFLTFMGLFDKERRATFNI